MKHFIGLLILSLFLVTTAYSQQPYSFADSSVLSRMKHDVYVLASDSFQGRKSGTIGEKSAYEYIISRFQQAGLSPKGDSGSWLQPFPYLIRALGTDNSLTINGKECRRYDDFDVMDISSSGDATGEIVDAGSGLFLPDAGIDDYRGVDVTGKIVLIDLYVPGKWIRDKATSAKVTPKSRFETAFLKGAAGVICYNPESHWGRKTPEFDRPDTLSKPVVYVTRKLAESILSSKNPSARIQTRFMTINYTYHNVVGFCGDPDAPVSVILGAHYDHEGVGSKTRLIKNGADDNASGTAMIMELARYYRQHPTPGTNYLFIAFSGEEEWLRGSKYFASRPTIDLSKVSFMFNFDMVGRLGAQGNRVEAVCTGTSPVWKKILRDAPGRTFRLKKVPGAGEFSDHHPFYKKDIPIAYLTTGIHSDYHTSRDDAEKINYTGMLSINKYAKGIIDNCEKSGKVPFTKVSGLTNFRSMLYYLGMQLHYAFTVGYGELD
ncbi:MAG TPA: M28 family peptidase, partial [Bacteroidales bacterium]|nr:M28 family peptidase [Bacteroidales bacterium]